MQVKKKQIFYVLMLGTAFVAGILLNGDSTRSAGLILAGASFAFLISEMINRSSRDRRKIKQQ